MSVRTVGLNSLDVKSSARKLMAQHVFAPLSVTVSDGHDYGLQDALLPHVTLVQARAAWTHLPTSLAAMVVDERDHF